MNQALLKRGLVDDWSGDWCTSYVLARSFSGARSGVRSTSWSKSRSICGSGLRVWSRSRSLSRSNA